MRVDLGVGADPEGTARQARARPDVDLDQFDVFRLEIMLLPELDGGVRVGDAAAGVRLDRIALDLVEVARLGQVVGRAGVGILVDSEQPGVAFQGVRRAGDAPPGQRGRPQRGSRGEGRLESFGESLVEKCLPVSRRLRVVDAQGVDRLVDVHPEHSAGRRGRSKTADDTGRQKPHDKVPAFRLLLPEGRSQAAGDFLAQDDGSQQLFAGSAGHFGRCQTCGQQRDRDVAHAELVSMVEVVGVGHRTVGEGRLRRGEFAAVDQQRGFRLAAPLAHLRDHLGDAPSVVTGDRHADRVEHHLLGGLVRLGRYVVRARIEGKLSQDLRQGPAAALFLCGIARALLGKRRANQGR